jgi:glycosyltransferase involved in cell wall biosynthesis
VLKTRFSRGPGRESPGGKKKNRWVGQGSSASWDRSSAGGTFPPSSGRCELPDLGLYLVGQNLGGLDPVERDGILALPWVKWEMELPEEELALFYSSLDVFAYLSEYEGFGFPPLEALACGTPAVVLERTSLAEVFRGLAVMVESAEEDEIARGLRSALTDERATSALVRKFAAERERFSWSRAAAELAGLLAGLKSEGRAP